MDKYLDLQKVWTAIDQVLTAKTSKGVLFGFEKMPLTEVQEVLLRFRDKLGESQSFCRKVNESFQRNSEEEFKKRFPKLFLGKMQIDQHFSILYHNNHKNWTLYKDRKVFLDMLSYKLVKSILVDINSAYLIKASREQKNAKTS